MRFLTNKYFKFGVALTLYLLWVIWVWNAWLLLGIPILFDIYITKKVNWTPWKKRDKENSTVVEWIDALIFAIIAVTFINIFFFQNYKIPTGSMEKSLLIGDHLYVSKLKFGPKIPNTPLAFPFTQNTMPLTKHTKSYLEWIQWPYKRLAGFHTIKNDNIVVFNFPEGDTVVTEHPETSYYAHILNEAKNLAYQDNYKRSMEYYQTQARQLLWSNYNIVARPVDRRDNYIKRCVAIPGDKLEIIDGHVFINGKPQKDIDKVQFRYQIVTDGLTINPLMLEKMGIYKDEFWKEEGMENTYSIFLTKENLEKLKNTPGIKSIQSTATPKGEYQDHIFPHNPRYPWNEDNWGPLTIPKKGVTVKIDTSNIDLYKRIICPYEGNTLEIKGGTIVINGKPATSYTFKMDYYFMVGDNRDNSADSRFWGFVPEDHIVGAPKVVWLSLDKEKSFPANIRWKRMFMWADK
ncbi:MAG TPA: S26 family signal peptidase [Bacteroidales bacterium]|nr:S26 family signal peptidase [Bacteroidales bacterium]